MCLLFRQGLLLCLRCNIFLENRERDIRPIEIIQGQHPDCNQIGVQPSRATHHGHRDDER